MASSALALAGAAFMPRRAHAADVKTVALDADPSLGDAEAVVPKALALIRGGLDSGMHIGAQLYVSKNTQPVADVAIGESRPGVAMRRDSLMVWYSCTKAVTAACVAQCWERGKLDLDDAVAKFLPEFGKHGKDKITLRHVLTHTGGFPRADESVRYITPWEVTIATICDAQLEKGWIIGEQAAYHPTSGWYILGEVVSRVDGRPFSQYVREEIFEPAGMLDCWVGMPQERFLEYGDRVGAMVHTKEGKVAPATDYDKLEGWCTLCAPGANGHGPIRELGRFYEMLLRKGANGTARLLSPQTVDAMTACHRFNVPNYGGDTPAPPWGLGLALNGVLYGDHASRRTFGHGGAESSVAFCDPERDLVVAMVFNGRPKSQENTDRIHDVSTAIYEDLRLA